jgi:hypothetical protein
MKKHDVYKYYPAFAEDCVNAELLQNDEKFDLIRWVFDQLILIYQAVTENEHLWITSQVQVEDNLKRMKDQSLQTIRKWRSSHKTRALLEEKLDKHYGAGYYQNLIDQYKLSDKKTPKTLDEKDCHPMDKQQFKDLSELDGKKMDALSDAFASMVFGDCYQSSGLKPTDNVDSLLNDVDEARRAVIKFNENQLSYERFKALFIEASAVPNISFLSQKEIDLVMLKAKEEREAETETKPELEKPLDSFVTPLKIPLSLKQSERKT